MAFHGYPGGLGEAGMAVEGRLGDAAGVEETAVVLEGEPHAEPHDGQPAPSSLSLRALHEGGRDAQPAMLGMDGEAADVEATLFFVPEHGADDRPGVFDDRAPAMAEVFGDGVGGLLQGARWGYGR